jgi:hypothetical protein
MLLAWAAAAAAMFMVVAARAEWWAGATFGPWHLLEALPALVLLVALAAHRLRQGRWHPVAPALIALSVTVHALGVLGHHGDWNRRHPEAGRPASLFSLRDTQIEAHGRQFLQTVGTHEWGLLRTPESRREGSKP